MLENDDSLFEAIFSQAVRDNFEQSLGELAAAAEEPEGIQLSEFHEARMRRMFAKTERRERNQAISKWTRQAASIAIVLMAALFGTLMFTAADVRADVLLRVTHWAEDVSYFFAHGTFNAPVAEEPAYIPDGYSESARLKSENLLSITYTDSTGSILLFKAIPNDSSLEINIVDMDYEQVAIGNVIYHVFSTKIAGNLNYIVWDTDGQRYYVGAHLPTDQLLEVAKSVK